MKLHFFVTKNKRLSYIIVPNLEDKNVPMDYLKNKGCTLIETVDPMDYMKDKSEPIDPKGTKIKVFAMKIMKAMIDENEVDICEETKKALEIEYKKITT